MEYTLRQNTLLSQCLLVNRRVEIDANKLYGQPDKIDQDKLLWTSIPSAWNPRLKSSCLNRKRAISRFLLDGSEREITT